MATPNQLGTVAFIKQDLIARQVIPDPQTSNCDSAEITIRLAWATRDQGAKLFAKTLAQNGCQKIGHPKVGHDAVAYPDGWVDVLVGAGPPKNTNEPAWQWHPGAPTGDLVAPWDLDAGSVPVGPSPVDPPVDPPPPDPELPTATELAVAVTLLAQDVAHLRQDLEKLNDVLELDMQSLGASLVRIEETQRRGLGGTVLNWKVRLVP